jgi:hypothetical protein
MTSPLPKCGPLGSVVLTFSASVPMTAMMQPLGAGAGGCLINRWARHKAQDKGLFTRWSSTYRMAQDDLRRNRGLSWDAAPRAGLLSCSRFIRPRNRGPMARSFICCDIRTADLALTLDVRVRERGWETERRPLAQATAPILDSTITDNLSRGLPGRLFDVQLKQRATSVGNARRPDVDPNATSVRMRCALNHST